MPHEGLGHNRGSGAESVADTPTDLRVGTAVYVRDRFQGDWSGGFAVDEVLPLGYRLRRLSDGYVFDEVFAFDDVRVERRKDPLRGVTGSHLDRRQIP